MTATPRASRRPRVLLAVATALLLLLLAGNAGPAHGQPARGATGAAVGPTVTLSTSQAAVGDTIVVTLGGWDTRAVTLSVCGNSGANGSVDCNMAGSYGVGLSRTSDLTATDMVLAGPPSPCPCVVKASDLQHRAVAFAPLDLVGHVGSPVAVDGGPAVAPEITIEAVGAKAGLLGQVRSSLGGPARYQVTVRVRNPSATPMAGLVVAAAGRRGGDDVVTVPVRPPATLAAGQEWSETVEVSLPAPSMGTFRWEASASAAGASSESAASTKRTPLLLVVLAVVLVVDLVVVVARVARRRRPRAHPR